MRVRFCIFEQLTPIPMKKLFTLFAFSCLASVSSIAQDCSGGRYYDQIFTDLEVTMGITYGENVQPTIIDPTATQVLDLDVYEPMGDTETQRPLIIFAFGGAFVAGSRVSPDIVELCTRFARAGYVCASIDYRLTQELLLLGNEETATRAVLKATHDMRAAVRYFRKNADEGNTYNIDPNTIYVAGVSAGGFAALHLAYLDKESEVPAVISSDFASVGGIEGLSGNAGYSSEVSAVVNLCGALGDKSWIEAGDPALMSVHGTADDVVPYGSGLLGILGINMMVDGSEALHPVATSNNIANSFTSFSGAGHTPFALGLDVANYMDTTWWAARDFLHWRTCGPPAAVPKPTLVNSALELAAVPNPANNATRIEIALQSNAQLTLTNLKGQTVPVKWHVVENGIEINTSELPEGVYLATVQTSTNKTLGTARLIVQH